MKIYYPDKKALNFLRGLVIILAAVLTFLCLSYLRSFKILMYILLGICWGGAFALIFIFLPLYFAKTSYSLGGSLIAKRSGMIFTTRQLMRGSAVQYLTTVITPLSSLTSLNFIIVNALGGKVFLAFLTREEIAEITSELNSYIKEGGSDEK